MQLKNMMVLLAAILFASCSTKTTNNETPDITTVCNPIDISYRFRPETDEPSRREAADPTVIKFKGEYWLFASKSGGYWHSKDLKNWAFVRAKRFPTEDYAPTAIVMRDTIFLAVSSKKNDTVYKCADPYSGIWMAENHLSHPAEDPFLFQDDDKKLYLYWGCHNVNPLYASEIDLNTFKDKSETVALIHQKPAEYGWEVRGDYNTQYDNPPWLEGLWMTKRKGKYYLQYSAPGTREKSYADGIYEGTSPLGPFTLAAHNPFSYKPEGFACGAGHGSTVIDAHGNYWHLGTISISVKHMFERRMGFYPAFFDADGVMYTQTQYGDYPIIIPDKKVESWEELFPGWMLLSYKKPVKVSSALEGFGAHNMVDENIRSYWSAQSGNSNEWAQIDLEKACDIYALQINFAEHNTTIYDRQPGLKYQYVVEGSLDGENWTMVLDKSGHDNDNSHDYTQLPHKVSYRYLRIKDILMADGNVALCGFRVFGKANGTMPAKVENLVAKRIESDRRGVRLSWDKVENATGYNISYGSKENKLYHNHIVFENNEVTIRSLNVNQAYYFAIEAFNESGRTKSESVVSVK